MRWWHLWFGNITSPQFITSSEVTPHGFKVIFKKKHSILIFLGGVEPFVNLGGTAGIEENIKINRFYQVNIQYLDLLCNIIFSSVSLVTQSCPILCDPMDGNTPGFPVHHQLPELAHTHVHWVSDAIQPPHLSRPLLLLPSVFPSTRVFSSESVLHIRWSKYWSFKHQSFQWIFRIDFL